MVSSSAGRAFSAPGAQGAKSIRQHYLFPLSGQRQGQIDGDLRLSGAVVAGEDRDAVGKHVLGRHKRFTSFFHKIVVLFFHLLYDVIVL